MKMNLWSCSRVLFAAVAICLPLTLFAQETVTIPKSRLDELERTAAEVNKLKAELATAQAELARLKGPAQIPATPVTATATATTTITPTAAPPAKPAKPVVSALPPLKKGEVVTATDLVNQYRADPDGADKRYHKGRIRVQAEIVAVSVPFFLRSYTVVLKTDDPHSRVECSFALPDEFAKVYAARHGQQIAAETKSGTRAVLAAVGESVVVEGECRGLHGEDVRLHGCKILNVP